MSIDSVNLKIHQLNWIAATPKIVTETENDEQTNQKNATLNKVSATNFDELSNKVF